MASTGATPGQRHPPLEARGADTLEKRVAAVAAAELVESGMRVGLGTGSTVAELLPALAARGLQGLRCVATSPATEREAVALGLEVCTLDELGELDIAIDGADQITPEGWLIKGGGGAHTREKIVAAAAMRFVVIASAAKAVEALAPPVPLELLRFGLGSTLAMVAPARLREVRDSPDGGTIADYQGPIGDPRRLADRLSGTPGVIDHGLFEPELVSTILIAHGEHVERRDGAKRP
ncbi:MAG TPA: ribose 5-phosphate isomerase A [Solirubrobacteraceae bacterium]|jgi:ribose 5-phosphate isomerase A|nr:ribose 5-phosphate isomerase A [Solirubrobacteraceae bacterium]